MIKALFTGLLILCAYTSHANAIRLPLQKALTNSDMKVSIRSRGGYCGKGLEVSIRNLSLQEYIVEVPDGLVFQPDNPNYQPLAIVRAPDLHLLPVSSDSCMLQTFCAHSAAWSPAANVPYSFLKVAEPGLMKVLQFISANKLYDYLGQHAVWAMTDNHPASSVYDYTRFEMSKKLSALVAAQKGEKCPQFYIIHNRSAMDQRGGRAFTPVPEEAVVELEWNDRDARIMYCEVVRADGTLYRKVPGKEYISAGNHRMHTVFKLKKTPRGTYYVRARDAMNQVWDEHKVVIE